MDYSSIHSCSRALILQLLLWRVITKIWMTGFEPAASILGFERSSLSLRAERIAQCLRRDRV
jgi:hypothetical protein